MRQNFVEEMGRLVFVGAVPKTVPEAFAITREKWETLNSFDEKGVDISSRGPETCGLCMLYFGNDCEDCPVAVYTKDVNCKNTPNDEYINAELPKAKLSRDILDLIDEVEAWWNSLEDEPKEAQE